MNVTIHCLTPLNSRVLDDSQKIAAQNVRVHPLHASRIRNGDAATAFSRICSTAAELPDFRQRPRIVRGLERGSAQQRLARNMQG